MTSIPPPERCHSTGGTGGTDTLNCGKPIVTTDRTGGGGTRPGAGGMLASTTQAALSDGGSPISNRSPSTRHCASLMPCSSPTSARKTTGTGGLIVACRRTTKGRSNRTLLSLKVRTGLIAVGSVAPGVVVAVAGWATPGLSVGDVVACVVPSDPDPADDVAGWPGEGVVIGATGVGAGVTTPGLPADPHPMRLSPAVDTTAITVTARRTRTCRLTVHRGTSPRAACMSLLRLAWSQDVPAVSKVPWPTPTAPTPISVGARIAERTSSWAPFDASTAPARLPPNGVIR